MSLRAGVTLALCLAALAPTPRAAASEAPPAPGPQAPADVAPADVAPAGEAPPGVAPGEARGWEEAPGPDATDVALALPRLVLSVPRLAAMALFWSVRQGLRFVERHRLVEHTVDLLYNDARTAALLPTASLESGYGLSFGANAFHKDLLGHGERLSAAARYGGRYGGRYQLAFEGARLAGTRLWLESLVRYESSPGLLFSGLGMQEDGGEPPAVPVGPRALALETRYRQDRLLGLLRLGTTLGERGRLVQTGVSLVYNRRRYGPEALRGDERALEAVYDPQRLAGFVRGVETLEVLASARLDTREREGLGASGLFVEAFGGGAPRMDGFGFWHTGLEARWTLDLYRGTRLLSFHAAWEAVAGPLADIPFSELPRLGGAHRLRGYPEGRFRDKQALVTGVEYHYPIHANVLGELYVDAGRVGERLGQLGALGGWRLGYGGGLLVGNRDDVALRLDLSYGEGWQVLVATDLARAFHGRSTQL